MSDLHPMSDSHPPAKARIHKTLWTSGSNIPGHYLLFPGSNSAWAGFKSKKEAETCLQVLPGWRYCKRV